MITVIDLAKVCECNHHTVRKWIKNNNVLTTKTKSSNGKKVQSLTDEDSFKFVSYWKETTTLPEGMITIPEVAKNNEVDRKTVRLWAEKNNVKLHLLRKSNGPPTHAISIKDAENFYNDYNCLEAIAVLDILSDFNTDFKVIRRWAKREQVDFISTKSNLGGRSKVSIKKEDYNKLKKYLMNMKSEGFFYMIQPVPEFNLNRIKLGFSRNTKHILKQHRSVCPNAKIIGRWKCHKDQEAKMISMVTFDCKQLYNEVNNNKTSTEVFDCEDYQIILDRLNDLFTTIYWTQN